MAAAELLLAAVYAWGVTRAWRHAGPGRGVRVHQVASFALGWLALAVAIEPHIHQWSARWLWAHMLQHELMIVVAAPLLAFGATDVALLWSLPAPWRRGWSRSRTRERLRRLGWLGSLPLLCGLHLVVLWLWHLPGLHQAALASDLVHAAQHASFLSTAVLFWWAVGRGEVRTGGHGGSVLAVFVVTMVCGALGALLTLSTRVWYPAYTGPAAGGITPLEDQQLGGLLMWVPAGIGFTLAGLLSLRGWLRQAARMRTEAARWGDVRPS
jgi:cytochrome c oxidase assembly factor CtaG